MAGKYTLDQNGARIQSILDFFEGYTFDASVNFPQYVLNTLADTTDNKIVSANRINLNNLYIKSGSYYSRIFSGGVNPSDPFSTGYLDFITNDTGASRVIAGYAMRYDAFTPLMNESSMESPDLGTRTTRGRDLYLRRNLTDGQYSITIAQLFNIYTNYLPRSAGSGNYLTGTLFSSVNDINFIGTQGKIGFRAYKTGTTDNAGQMLITADSQVEGSYRLSIQAGNGSMNGYNTLRMGDSEGLTYKLNDNVLFHVDNNGKVTIGSNPVDNLDVATKQYVDSKSTLFLHKLNVTCTDSNSNTIHLNFSVFTNSPNLVTGYLQQNYLIFDFTTNTISFMGASGSEFVTAIDSSSDPKFYALKMTLGGTGKYGFNPAGIIPLSNNATSPSLAVLATFYISDIVQKF